MVNIIELGKFLSRMSNICYLCNKSFEYLYLLERHKNNKKPCNISKESYNCNICKSDFNHKSHLERHKKSKNHINKYKIYVENLNIENLNIDNSINNIDNSINITNNITLINGFSETNIDIIELKDIERLLIYEDNIHKIIKEFAEDPDGMYGSSEYIILIFKFYIKIFAKLNFNLAYSENHNCKIFSFNRSDSKFIEYQLLEINNTQFNYDKKCIDYKLFIEQFINLMDRINNKFENFTLNYIFKYIIRYKKMLFTSENAKIKIENELLTSYTKFEESKNNLESEDERFRIALLTSRANAFKGIIRRIDN